MFLLDFNEWFTIFHYPTLKYTMELPVLSSDEKLLGIEIKIIPNILLEIVLEDKLRFIDETFLYLKLFLFIASSEETSSKTKRSRWAKRFSHQKSFWTIVVFTKNTLFHLGNKIY